MKKLLVLMLCAVLAVPSVGMKAQASGQIESNLGVNEEIGLINENGGGTQGIAEPTPEEMAEDAKIIIRDYYLIKILQKMKKQQRTK